MKYSDHYILSKYVADSFEIGGRVNRISFIWGNISPDLNKLTYLHGYGYLLERLVDAGYKLSLNQRRKLLIAGHTAEGARCYVNKYSRRLIKKKKWNFIDWYRFGKVVHYVTDRFTYPHTLMYRDGFFKHVAYEEELHECFEKMMDEMRKNSKSNTELRSMVNKHFAGVALDSIYRAYRNEDMSIVNDCIYILAACTKYADHILRRHRLKAIAG